MVQGIRAVAPWRAFWIATRADHRTARCYKIKRQSRRRIQLAISPTVRHEHTEGQVAKTIEEQTAKLPSDTFLWAAVAAMGASATFQLMGNKNASMFVGQWAPTLLIFGLYNKLVKQLGSDFTDTRARV
jgi:hypothetical protein